MGLLGSLIGTALDVVTAPLNVLEDVVRLDPTLSSTRGKIKTVANDVKDCVEDTVDLDLI